MRGALARRRPARGQAIVEFLVAATVLVPLVAGIVVAGRLQDLRSVTVQSARYAAFAQALATAPTPELEMEVRARFFADPDRALRATEDGADRAANPHWVDLGRDQDPLIARAESVTLRTGNAPPPGVAAAALGTALAGVDRVAAVTGGTFDLERHGYYGADVSVRIAAVPMLEIVGAPPLTLRARAQVLGRDWAATGPAETAERASALVPTSPLRGLRPLIAPFTWALSLLEPALRDLCLARVDPDLVPLDRLGPPGSDDTGQWVAPCE
jgi:hypothetical protein